MTDEANPAGEPPTLTEKEARAATRTIFRLFEACELSEKESRDVLGGLTERQFQSLRDGDLVPITGDLAKRLGLLLGIHRCMRLLFRSAARRKGWSRAPNRGLGGQTALAVMSQPDIAGMRSLERYLEAVVQHG